MSVSACMSVRDGKLNRCNIENEESEREKKRRRDQQRERERERETRDRRKRGKEGGERDRGKM